MERVRILVIGAGVIGLSVGCKLLDIADDIVIIEKEDSFGRHTSSRNSEVIHSGIYYTPGSLKARLCTKGRKLLYNYLSDHKISHRRCGKLVVATSKEELPALYQLYKNGLASGVEDLSIIGAEECRRIIPEVKAVMALNVPGTGIMDTHAYMKSLKQEFENRGGFIMFSREVIDIKFTEEGYLVQLDDGEELLVERLINCSGLHSEQLLNLLGVDTEAAGLKLHWCKGEYYKTTQKFEIDRLIYPLPDPSGSYLGIHLTLNLAGEIRFGPNAYYTDKLDYSMTDDHRKEFIDAISKYLKIEVEILHADDTGIRAKLQGEGEKFRDFHIKQEFDLGLPGFINLSGIESPGLTCSLAIGEYVRDITV